MSVVSRMHRAFRCTAAERRSRAGPLDRPRPHDDHLVAQPQCSAVDQSRSEQLSRAIGPGFERILALAA